MVGQNVVDENAEGAGVGTAWPPGIGMSVSSTIDDGNSDGKIDGIIESVSEVPMLGEVVLGTCSVVGSKVGAADGAADGVEGENWKK